ncbi:alpha/beta-hydrolase [Auriculariales sp. MPI-PUGE-AT-0066]|nr:alpha/beta-hydrolase [Auriculariales sp. MPI-PUGE-AT-0066]
MALPICADCTKGFTLEGQPAGTTLPDGGYFHAAPSGTPSKAAIVLFTDIFGLGIPNPKILADKYSTMLDVDVYVPDYFNGKPPVTIEELEPYEDVEPGAKPGIVKQLKMVASLLPKAPSLFSNRPSVAVSRVTPLLESLRKDKGYKAIGTIGFCFGGGINIQIGGTDLVDSVIIAHPGGSVGAASIAKIKVPNLWIAPQEDKFFSDAARQAAEQQFAARKGKPTEVQYKFIDYEGTTHGFACRPALQHPKIKEAFEKSVADTLEWFQKTVVDKAAAAAIESKPVAAAAAAPAGVVSTTEAPAPTAAIAAPVPQKLESVEQPKDVDSSHTSDEVKKETVPERKKEATTQETTAAPAAGHSAAGTHGAAAVSTGTSGPAAAAAAAEGGQAAAGDGGAAGGGGGGGGDGGAGGE